MHKLVKWLTGTPRIPILGFKKKFTVSFIHGCRVACKCWPTASTCDLLLKLPVHIASYEEMGVMMNSALNDCIGFGVV